MTGGRPKTHRWCTKAKAFGNAQALSGDGGAQAVLTKRGVQTENESNWGWAEICHGVLSGCQAHNQRL